MPEGPELFLTSRYVNDVCRGVIFSGRVEKSQVSKNSEVPFESEEYFISATSRGKEFKLTLTPVKWEHCKGHSRSSKGQEPMDLIFRFGMSGSFKLTSATEIPKHAHLRFYTKESPLRVLCFVDPRRFGRWVVGGSWQPDRGPCVMLEYEEFRENVLKNLSDKAFNKPICEALLNQTFFNGIGNYLRAEILHRLKIPPFEKARTVLENLQHQEQKAALTLSKKLKLKQENPDLLALCHMVPMEVIHLDGKGYDPGTSDYSAFAKWLQCYSVPGMKSLPDTNGRTVWFQGNPGPLVPKGGKSRKRKLQVKAKPEVSSPKVPLVPKGRKSRKRKLQVKAEPEIASPKVRKSGTRKNAKTSTRREGPGETPGKKKGGKPAQENAEDAGGTGSRNPKARARRKTLPSQESPMVVSAAKAQKRRRSARISTGPRSQAEYSSTKMAQEMTDEFSNLVQSLP